MSGVTYDAGTLIAVERGCGAMWTLAVTASAREDLIVTSDPEDLQRIASAMGRSVQVYVPG